MTFGHIKNRKENYIEQQIKLIVGKSLFMKSSRRFIRDLFANLGA